MEETDIIRVEIEYPAFRKIVPKDVTLEDVRRITSKIKGSLAEEVVREREEEWR
jgi:hypothetical protein